MSPRLAALSAFVMSLAVASGAFGAHALREIVPPQDLAIWDKAVLYHLIHGMIALVVSMNPGGALSAQTARRIASLFILSILVFSGSLYLLVLLNMRWLGAITPIGGSGFIVAWLVLSVSLYRHAGKHPPTVA